MVFIRKVYVVECFFFEVWLDSLLLSEEIKEKFYYVFFIFE